jgi:hypothetical protein
MLPLAPVARRSPSRPIHGRVASSTAPPLHQEPCRQRFLFRNGRCRSLPDLVRSADSLGFSTTRHKMA